MQDDHFNQTPLAISDECDWNEDNLDDLDPDETVNASPITETQFLSVMSEREMEILTTWFPKSAATVACVLRNRPQWLKATAKTLYETR